MAVKVPAVVAIEPLMKIPAMAHLQSTDETSKKLIDMFMNSSISDFSKKLDIIAKMKKEEVEITKEQALLKK